MTGTLVRPARGDAPAGPGRTLLLAGPGLFMPAPGNTVGTTARPVIGVSLHSSLPDREWTLTAYLWSFACFLLAGAALGDRSGRRRIFCGGLAVVTAASAAAALSPAAGALIAAGAVPGAGAAMVMPLTRTVIGDAFPGEKRAAAIGVRGGIAALAVAAGPVIGGAVAGGLDWHWIFWLHVPVGLAMIPLSLRRRRESSGPRPRPDVAGLLRAGAGFPGITRGLISATTAGWSSAGVIAPLILAVAPAGAFPRREHRAPAPLLSLALFRRSRFTTATGASFVMNASVSGALFLMAQFVQTAQHDSPRPTGVRLVPWTAAAMVSSPIAGKLAQNHGSRPVLAAGLLLQGAGPGRVASAATAHLRYTGLGLALPVAGTGIGMVFPTVAAEIVASVPAGDIGVASGTNSARRELGGASGVSVLAAVFSRPGVYLSPGTFVTGFRAALWAGAGFSAAGAILPATTIPRRQPAPDAPGRAGPSRADAGN